MTFTANGKQQLLPSLFSCVYSRVKLFVFAVNSKRPVGVDNLYLLAVQFSHN